MGHPRTPIHILKNRLLRRKLRPVYCWLLRRGLRISSPTHFRSPGRAGGELVKPHGGADGSGARASEARRGFGGA